jgi:hypothetical protein
MLKVVLSHLWLFILERHHSEVGLAQIMIYHYTKAGNSALVRKVGQITISVSCDYEITTFLQ